MNTLYKILIAVAVVVTASQIVFAQDEDEIEYEPIHATILPGDVRLHIEEKFGKKSSVMFVGDELMFKSKKMEAAASEFELPLNPVQDFTLELTFMAPKLKKGLITVGSDIFAITFGSKIVFVNDANGIVFTDKKWKLPKSDVKDEVVCRIVRHKRNYTFYINNKYVCETTINQSSSSFPFAIIFASLKSEILLKSIRVDQGPEDEE